MLSVTNRSMFLSACHPLYAVRASSDKTCTAQISSLSLLNGFLTPLQHIAAGAMHPPSLQTKARVLSAVDKASCLVLNKCNVMQNFVENFSEFSAAQRNAGKHVTIMSELSRLVDTRTLMQVLPLQLGLPYYGSEQAFIQAFIS